MVEENPFKQFLWPLALLVAFCFGGWIMQLINLSAVESECRTKGSIYHNSWMYDRPVFFKCTPIELTVQSPAGGGV